jgi:hypothetical protein
MGRRGRLTLEMHRNPLPLALVPDHWKLGTVQSWESSPESRLCIPFGGHRKFLDPGGRGGIGFHTLALIVK